VKDHLKGSVQSPDHSTTLPKDYQKELIQRCLKMMTPLTSKHEVCRFS
jgi:hypothetical protein